jgi:hypothetical protein
MTIETTRPVTTPSGETVEALYGPEDVGPFEERIGHPGEAGREGVAVDTLDDDARDVVVVGGTIPRRATSTS